MGNGPSDIARDQIDDSAGRRGEAQNAQLMVHKHGANPGTGKQIVHVVVAPRQIAYLRLQFGIDRRQFLVDRLQFFLGGLQFLVGGLQFLVHRLHFLVGRLQLLVGGFQLLLGGLQVLILGSQLLLERCDAHFGAGRCVDSRACSRSD